MNTEDRTREDLAKRLVHALALADMEAMPEWDSEDEFWRFMVDKAVMPVIDDLQGRIDNVLTLLSQEGVALFHPQPTTLHEHPIPSFARDRIRAVLRGVQLEVSQ